MAADNTYSFIKNIYKIIKIYTLKISYINLWAGIYVILEFMWYVGEGMFMNDGALKVFFPNDDCINKLKALEYYLCNFNFTSTMILCVCVFLIRIFIYLSNEDFSFSSTYHFLHFIFEIFAQLFLLFIKSVFFNIKDQYVQIYKHFWKITIIYF